MADSSRVVNVLGKRAQKGKVKTGCITCKIRRVKCDEAKPACDRCRKFGRKCDGYEADLPKETETLQRVAKFRPLLKKSLPVTKQPAILVFRTGEEFRCFQLYCEETAPRLSGVLGGSLWHRLLLQASHEQPFIRHAVFTIGALSKMLKGGGLGQFKIEIESTGDDEAVLKQYYDFALWHYDKFLQETRAHILNGEHGRRMAFIACLLIICIEYLQNNTDSALRHAQSGIQMMHAFLAETPPSPSQSIDENTIEWKGNLASLPGISSPAPHIIEDELVQQFNRLHMQTLAVFSFQLPEQHSRLKREGSNAIRTMSSVFVDTHDARLFLDLIIRRAYHFMSEGLLGQNIVTIGTVNSVPSYTDQEVYSRRRTPSRVSQFPLHIQDQLQIEHEIYRSEIRRWSRAFEPLFRSTQLDASHPGALSANLLKIRSLSLSIRLAGHMSSSELIYDQFLPEFQQIVTLGRALIKHAERQPLFEDGVFTFDMGLIFDFSIVPISCRDRKLRREAISFLNIKNWKEGTWGSKTCADIGICIMGLEEEGVETYDIPESTRVRLTGCAVDVNKRTAALQFVHGVGENAVTRNCLRDWSSML